MLDGNKCEWTEITICIVFSIVSIEVLDSMVRGQDCKSKSKNKRESEVIDICKVPRYPSRCQDEVVRGSCTLR